MDYKIGIDPSINSTGVCVYDSTSKTNYYYIIASHMTKKMKEFDHERVKFYPYAKLETTHLDYPLKERNKTSNLISISDNIDNIIRSLPSPSSISFCMEGISYGSAGGGQVADLAGLNYLIRSVIVKYGDFTIVPPTTLKSWATGNGAADKEMMIASWKKIDTAMTDITSVKIDDCADAFFLAHYLER